MIQREEGPKESCSQQAVLQQLVPLRPHISSVEVEVEAEVGVEELLLQNVEGQQKRQLLSSVGGVLQVLLVKESQS